MELPTEDTTSQSLLALPRPGEKIEPTSLASAAQMYAPLREEFAHITQKMYTQNLALAQTNRTLSMLRAIDSLILDSSRDLAHLSQEISKTFVDIVPYPVAGILSLNRYNEELLTMQGFAQSQLLPRSSLADDLPIIRNLYLNLEGEWLKSRQHYLVINANNPRLKSDLEELGFDENFVQAVQGFHDECGVKALYLTKLFARNNLNGVLMVGLEDPLPMIDDMELIERLGEPAGIALDNRLLYEENQRFLRQLQATNSHLKELDQAKDEFIALVSHQLRTPLTSVKGLLSLVLEGDTGPLPDQQRTMLQQAFDSSQRMVYLIADLLNASRLRSGKFAIMNRETYLPELVETEVKQLAETASSRNVELTFTRPEEFPKLMIDDMKVRQVIMNFLDNALYYTPSGGRVVVDLQATDKSIEFRVTDTGLGVPAAERNKLFTKFYRAGNAKKVRPEGTGLGLYMAKKVIVAQGGAIIFESTEGKGSTFGFMFPLDKVKVPAAAKPAT